MAIETSRFVIPENRFEALNVAAEGLRQDKARKDEEAQLQYQRQQSNEAKKLATAKFLEGYYDPKDHLSGTIYDDQVTKQILDLRNEAQNMVNQGVSDPNMITAAIAPKANRLFQYSQTAKYINDNLDKQLQNIPANSGYIKDKLRQRALDAAFKDDKGQLKDITTIDPDIDWIGEAVKRYPKDVTNNTGLNEFIQKVPKGTQLIDAKTYNSRGGFTRKKLKVTAPEFMQLDIDERGNETRELVPKFELAMDDENPIIHPFEGKDGKIVNAQVRLVDENVFKQILASNPSYADNLRGQVMEVLGQYKNKDGSEIDINSPQATNVARALLYDDLKNLRPGTVEDVVETKPTQIKVYNTSGGSKKEVEKIDLTEYRDVPGEGKDITDLMGGVKISSLPDGKSFLAEKVHYNPATQKVRFIEYVSKDEQGKYGTPKWKESSLTKFIQDVKTMNPGTDMKFLEGLRNPITGAKAETSSEYEIKGKKYTEAELLKMGYNKEQIAPYKK